MKKINISILVVLGVNNYLSDPILQFIYETMQICINIEIYTIENRTFTKSFT